MLKNLILTLISWGTGRSFAMRSMTHDVAFKFRMGAGLPGEANRTHPVTITTEMQSVANPSTSYGQAVVVDTGDANRGVRPFAGGDAGLTQIWGVTVRPFPTSPGGTVTAPGASATLGSAAPSATGVIDVERRGFIMVKIPAAEAALATKGSAVFVRCAASPGADDPVSGFKAQADGGNTAALDTTAYTFNGSADASGNVELCVKV